jgi:phospholipid/cholesterol/gamma-HCH transport system substrate-binding protein
VSSKGLASRISPEWLALLLVAIVVGLIALSLGAFNRSFAATLPVTLTSDRSGLVMEPNAKVKMRGVQIGRVSEITGGTDQVSLRLDLDPEQAAAIPANVEARINSASLFGSKYVELIAPAHPSMQPLSAGAILRSQNVTVEVNTVFENLVALIDKIQPDKLNAVLSALAEGFRGQGEHMGHSITDSNDVLVALNSRTETIRSDWNALRDVSDTYNAAAQNIIAIMDAASTTSETVTSQAAQLDALLVGVAGLSRSGVDVLGTSKDKLIEAVNILQPTTDLLLKYDPSLTCTLVGAERLQQDHLQTTGGNGKSLIMDAALMLGDDPYRYPDNLPVNGATGGPGGKPSCGSLPDVAQNWPVRYLVADTGYGTGLDIRPNPGIGFPGWANYFPVTRAVPEPPSIRYEGGPAPGPVPYPGAPPYGAPFYGPDGTPLYPGVPSPPQPEPQGSGNSTDAIPNQP